MIFIVAGLWAVAVFVGGYWAGRLRGFSQGYDRGYLNGHAAFRARPASWEQAIQPPPGIAVVIDALSGHPIPSAAPPFDYCASHTAPELTKAHEIAREAQGAVDHARDLGLEGDK